ncbi:chromate transporter-domain-containing protein [Hyaloraphidium curvatum]|nr:chromate transporter-domain-containing protein [Hyaloraphidium curvatum]
MSPAKARSSTEVAPGSATPPPGDAPAPDRPSRPRRPPSAPADPPDSLPLIQPEFTKRPLRERLAETFWTYLPLGFTTLGGPQATVSQYFSIFVVKNHFITERTYAELFGITSSLPGPGNAGFSWAVALIRGGLLCAILSFFVWTAPSLFVYIGVAIGLSLSGGVSELPGWAVGIKNGAVGSAVGLVALAAFRLTAKIVLLDGTPVRVLPGMSASERAVVAHSRNRRVFAVALCTITLVVVIVAQPVWKFPVVMALAGAAGFVYEWGHERGLWAWFTEAKHGLRARMPGKAAKRTPTVVVEEDLGADVELQTRGKRSDAADLAPAADSDSVVDDWVPDGLEQISAPGAAVLRRRPSIAASAMTAGSGLSPRARMEPDPLAITFSNHVKPNQPPLAPYFPPTLVNMLPLAVLYVLVLATGFTCQFGPVRNPLLNLYGMMVVCGVIVFGGWASLLPLWTSFAVEQYGFATISELTFLVALQNALPGPLFNAAAFVGALAFRSSGPGVMILTGWLAFVSIFLPGMLMFSITIPSYAKIREYPAMQWIFSGINAASTGLMFQAVYVISVQSITGRDKGTSILGYPVFLSLAVITFVLCCDYGGDGRGGINPAWAIFVGAAVGVLEWAIVLR